ncbi:protein of unknown function [Methylocaldum szegediense]|uniref:Uncharacterized protein n=1 Tax=Methylocaldum szegediense TaxID=73780 RepID=A0ABN8WXL3_9GAMM|nr:protein of unknown function [Methylocaldum szegediense]
MPPVPKPSERIYPRRLDGVQEARLIALAGPPPLELAALGGAPRRVENRRDRRVRNCSTHAQKTELKPHLGKRWVILPSTILLVLINLPFCALRHSS